MPFKLIIRTLCDVFCITRISKLPCSGSAAFISAVKAIGRLFARWWQPVVFQISGDAIIILLFHSRFDLSLRELVGSFIEDHLEW